MATMLKKLRPTSTPCNVVRALSWMALCVGCGGPPAAEQPSSRVAPDGASDEAVSASLIDGDPLGDEAPTPAKPADPMARCEGGQCFRCGDNICPESFYCDSGNGCAWLPQCTGGRLSCECLESQLKGCRCDDTDGHPTVSCEK